MEGDLHSESASLYFASLADLNHGADRRMRERQQARRPQQLLFADRNGFVT